MTPRALKMQAGFKKILTVWDRLQWPFIKKKIIFERLNLSFFQMANAISHIILTFFLAALLCLTFESPIHGIEKILLRMFGKHKTWLEVAEHVLEWKPPVCRRSVARHWQDGRMIWLWRFLNKRKIKYLTNNYFSARPVLSDNARRDQEEILRNTSQSKMES